METTDYFKGPDNFCDVSPSSTNAYMLIYRLKDPTRNASMLAHDKVISFSGLENVTAFR